VVVDLGTTDQLRRRLGEGRIPRRSIIGKNTRCIRSGLYRGFASMIDGIVEHVITEFGRQDDGDRQKGDQARQRATSRRIGRYKDHSRGSRNHIVATILTMRCKGMPLGRIPLAWLNLIMGFRARMAKLFCVAMLIGVQSVPLPGQGRHVSEPAVNLGDTSFLDGLAGPGLVVEQIGDAARKNHGFSRKRCAGRGSSEQHQRLDAHCMA
jgi:hypothetical protein